MRLARGWKPWVLAPLVLGLATLGLSSQTGLFPAGSIALLAASLLLAAFFRDPDREIGEGIVAAADGRVREAGPDRIVTFLNVHDVHVVRAPYAGRVTRIRRLEGPHRPAFLEDADKNAGVSIALSTAWGEKTLYLLAGLVARRAVAWVEEGQEVAKGERVGMIRLGSRVDVDLPEGAEILVEPGQAVRAGSSTLADAPPLEGEGPA